MPHESKTQHDPTARVVFAVLATTAATAFAIQAWMTYGFGREVWGIPVPLSVALIVALDVFAIMFMILTYLLRETGWPRLVVTLVFMFAIGSQVAAAEMFGAHEGWPVEVRWFSAIPAVILALSQEGVILWRTHRADREAAPAEPAPKPKREPAAAPATHQQVIRPLPPTASKPVPVKSKQREQGDRRRGRPVDPAEQARRDAAAASVIALGVDAQTKRAAATSNGVSVKTIENWIASYHERHPEQPDSRPINGEKPQLSEGVQV